jgi:hypothetical protein
MVKTLELAISKAAELPEEAQEALGRDMLRRIQAFDELRAEIDIGIRQLDAGLGRELDMEELLNQLHREHDSKR